MKVIIAEKPSVAREIAQIVGAHTKQEGYIEGNGYAVTWALGHLVSPSMPEAYGATGFNREHLPIIPEPFQLNVRQEKSDKGYKDSPQHSNILEFNANWKEAIDICINRGIAELIVGGDLYQSRSSQTLDVLLAVRSFLLYARSKGVYVTLANGNHDLVNQDAFEGYCHVFSDYPDVYVIDDFAAYDISDSVVIHTVAYFPETGRFLDVYKDLLETIDKSKTNILYLHAGINGALAHPSEKDLPANMFKDFDKVLVGHYHNRCHIKDSNVYYIGSSRQHNFGEDEAKGYTIVNADGSIEYIDNQVNTRYTTIETSFRKWNHPDTILQLNNYRDGGKYKVRLRINCKQEEASSVDKKMLLEAGANKVEIVVTDMKVIESKTSSLFHKFDTKQIVNTYSDFCNEKGIPDASLGIEYLSQIN